MEEKNFNVNTIKELKEAEKFQQQLYKKYDKVIIETIGINRIKMQGLD